MAFKKKTMSLNRLNAAYKESIGDMIESCKFAIDNKNHEKVESSKFFGLFSNSKKKSHKGGFNTLGKSVQINQNIGDFKRVDPAVEAGKVMKDDKIVKEDIDNFFGIDGYVKPQHPNRPTTKIANIEDEHSFEKEEEKTPAKEEPKIEHDEYKIEVDDEDVIHEKSPGFEYVEKEEAEGATKED